MAEANRPNKRPHFNCLVLAEHHNVTPEKQLEYDDGKFFSGTGRYLLSGFIQPGG